jgi:hypothetical protein
MLRFAVVVLVLALAAGVVRASPAAPAPPTAEALLAAGIPWTTVRRVAGPDWWPGVPQFESPPLFRQPLPKRPLVVTSQWYVRPGADTMIQTTLLAFAGAREPGICPSLAETDGVPMDVHAPAVGVNHVFWTPGDASAPVTILCFERGPVAVEIEVLGEKWHAARLGELAKPVAANLEALLAGTLPYGVGNGTLEPLPLAADAPGKVLGTAALRPEAWASSASRPTPAQLAAQLKRGGSTTLPFRRYVLSGGENVVDVTVFSFAGEAAAGRWFDTLSRASATASTELPAPAAGTHVLLRQLDEYIVLDFVAGWTVADATCYAPYGGQPSSACAAVLHRLGERWYAQLSHA